MLRYLILELCQAITVADKQVTRVQRASNDADEGD